jgi:hypothetical protein
MKISLCALVLAAVTTFTSSTSGAQQTPPRPPAPPAPAAPPAPPSPPPVAPAAPVPPSPPPMASGALRQVGPVTPLRVQVTISRYLGDRKVSSFPYVLLVNANEGSFDPRGKYSPDAITRLRTGSRLPVAPSISADPGSKDNVTVYQSIGTNIDCWAQGLDDNRFRVTLSIEDSSVYPDGPGGGAASQRPGDRPSIRSFQSNTSVILRDKQTTEFTAAADKITGEVTRIEVSITVEK